MYAEMTGGWGVGHLENFRMGAGIRKTRARLKVWNFQPHPPMSREGDGGGKMNE